MKRTIVGFLVMILFVTIISLTLTSQPEIANGQTPKGGGNVSLQDQIVAVQTKTPPWQSNIVGQGPKGWDPEGESLQDAMIRVQGQTPAPLPTEKWTKERLRLAILSLGH